LRTTVGTGRSTRQFELPTDKKPSSTTWPSSAKLIARRATVCLAWRTYLEVEVLYTPDKGKC
jgi:hypothetical protein